VPVYISLKVEMLEQVTRGPLPVYGCRCSEILNTWRIGMGLEGMDTWILEGMGLLILVPSLLLSSLLLGSSSCFISSIRLSKLLFFLLYGGGGLSSTWDLWRCS